MTATLAIDRQETTVPTRPHLWVYTVLPPVLIGLVSMLVYATYYSLEAVRPELVTGISPGRLTSWISAFILVVRWALALSIVVGLRRDGRSAMDLIAPGGHPWRFRWRPALALFLALNALMVPLIAAVEMLWGGMSMFPGEPLWLRIFWFVAIPVTAGFTEELIWRGHVVTQFEARGRTRWTAILLSATSFALIHGTPVHWAITFLFGVVGGLYYTRERNLVPLMVTHAFVDLWSFGMYLF